MRCLTLIRKSRLRKPEEAEVGPRYSGARVSRRAFDDVSDSDPFARPTNGERSDVSDQEASGEESGEGSGDGDVADEAGVAWPKTTDSKSDSTTRPDEEEPTFLGVSGSTSEEDDGSGSEDKSSTDGDEQSSQGEQSESSQRAALRKMMSESQKTVLDSITQATRADADKGRAVKGQRQTFDTLLNTRIRLQKALVSTNSLSDLSPADASGAPFQAAEQAAVHLWDQLNDLRTALSDASPKRKRKRSTTAVESSSASLWDAMTEHSQQLRPVRRATLDKWASKARAVPTLTTARRLNNTASHQQSLSEVLDGHLSRGNISRLTQRTRIARSCAPLQAAQTGGKEEVQGIFDDADFYQLLLKEVV